MSHYINNFNSNLLFNLLQNDWGPQIVKRSKHLLKITGGCFYYTMFYILAKCFVTLVSSKIKVLKIYFGI